MGLTMSEEFMRDFGSAMAQIGEIRRNLDKMDIRMTEIEKAQASILGKINEARGGWKVLMLLGGAGAALGSLLSWSFGSVIFKIGG